MINIDEFESQSEYLDYLIHEYLDYLIQESILNDEPLTYE